MLIRKVSLAIAAGIVTLGCHTMEREIVSTRVDPETGAEIQETTVETSKVFDENQAAYAAKAAKWAISAYAGAQKQKAEAKGAKFQFFRDWSESQQDRMERQGDTWYDRFKERGGAEGAPDLNAAIEGVRDLLKGD